MKPERSSLFGRRRLRLRTLRLRDALVLSVPIWIALLYPFASAVSDFATMHAFDDWFVHEHPLQKLVRTRFSASVRLLKAQATRIHLDIEDPDPAAIHLQVDRRTWRAWQGEPAALWGTWVEANLVDGKSIRGVKIRKRGDTSVHWLTEKKSMTLKMERDQPFRGYRKLALSGKSVAQQVVTNNLAHEFDLLAPMTTVAPVFVNRRFYGLFRATETIDESFLRRHERLPGNIFRGDTAEPGELFRGLPRNLFVNPYIWDRVAFNSRPSAPGPVAMMDFIRDQNGSTFEDHLRWLKRLDPSEVARLVAYLLVVGDPYHLTDLHNQFWYEDPSSGTLHPIPWDIRAFKLDAMDWRINEALSAALKNPFVVDEAMTTLAAKLKNDGVLKAVESQIANLNQRHHEYMKYEDTRGESIPRMGKLEAPLETIRYNTALLGTWMKDAAVDFHAETATQGVTVLDFSSRGRVGAKLKAFEFERPAGNLKTKLFADSNRNGRLDSDDREIDVRWVGGTRAVDTTLALKTPHILLPGISKKLNVEPGHLHYRFFLMTGAPARSVQPVLSNRITQEVVEPGVWSAGTVIAAPLGWHPWQYPVNSKEDVHLTGEVHLTQTLRIEEHQTLHIAPGSTIRLAPDVSILARGRVLAQGTEQQPIAIVSAVADPDAQAPWGSLVLQGAGANESLFEHVKVEGGGGAILDGVEYKGMVSVHHCRNVTFKSCEFVGNLRSDDAFNGVHSAVAVLDSKFMNANADAVDLDHSSGQIRNCVFQKSRNDGIDLMTSSPLIENNRIIESGDKGISIGERSNPTLVNNTIVGCAIGSAVKDASEPKMVSNTFEDNAIGIVQAAKNWRYAAGGFSKLFGNHLKNNTTDFDFDSKSRVTKSDTAPSWISTEPKERVRFLENFASSDDGWVRGGGTTRLKKRGHTLIAGLRESRGHFSKAIDWKLQQPGVVVLEIGGTGFSDGVVELKSAQGNVTRPFTPQSPRTSAFVEVEVPPGHYVELRISATPTEAPARVHLHGYTLY